MCIINHTYKFVFVHVPKSAGTSITNVLSTLTNYCDQEIGGTAFGERIQPAYRDRFGLAKHSSANEIRNIMGRPLWGRYFTFAFVRNPFSRCLSTYHFLRRWEGSMSEFHDQMRAFKTLDEYVMSDIWEHGNGPDQIFRPQIYWLRSNQGGQLLTSFVGKVENIAEDLRRILDVVGASWPALKLGDVPRLNQSPGESELADLSGRAIQKIQEKYRTDFELFEYPLDPES
ncbi:MAG: sulfotransferase family 2 domain-containing protein [Burkholderiales bacterium]|nr:sulfotransferase family 2 domain-containing protein [Burkholderiales bacterium]